MLWGYMLSKGCSGGNFLHKEVFVLKIVLGNAWILSRVLRSYLTLLNGRESQYPGSYLSQYILTCFHAPSLARGVC